MSRPDFNRDAFSARKERDLLRREQELRERELNLKERKLALQEAGLHGEAQPATQVDSTQEGTRQNQVSSEALSARPDAQKEPIKRIDTGKTAKLLSNSTTAAVVSAILTGWAFLNFVGLFIVIADPAAAMDAGARAGFLAMVIPASLGSAFAFVIFRKSKRRGNLYRRYLDVLIKQQEDSLDKISTVIGKSYEDVKVDLQIMIDEGYLRGAYLNDKERRIVVLINDRKEHQQQAEFDQTANQQTEVVVCPSCHARQQVVVGQPGMCEYCRSPL